MSKFWRLLFTFIISMLVIALILSSIKWGYNFYNRKIYGVAKGVYLEGIKMEGYLRHEVSQIVEFLAFEKERKPQNAAINKQTGDIIPGKSGIAVDQERTIGLVLYSQQNTDLELITYIVEPDIAAHELTKITKILGSYTTFFSGSPGRYQNIKTAMQTINNTLVMPNELFTFNLAIGPVTVNRGFHLAPVIIGEGHTLGLGGGVCQVSSTLYNAARLSKLTIIERHAHSKPVRYVPPGFDAAVAAGSKDLKFKNSYLTPIIIKSSLQGTKIYVWILGSKEP